MLISASIPHLYLMGGTKNEGINASMCTCSYADNSAPEKTCLVHRSLTSSPATQQQISDYKSWDVLLTTRATEMGHQVISHNHTF